MPLSNGLHHATVITADMDRFIAFYTAMFDANVLMDMTETDPRNGRLRHALLDLGGGFALHPFEFDSDTGQQHGSDRMATRGHIDHLALQFDTGAAFATARERLVKAGASDGTITDFGGIRIASFRDPDGMEGEIAIWTGDSAVRAFADRVRIPYPDSA